MHGRITAMDMLLKAVMKASPNAALAEAAESMGKVSDFLDATGDEKKKFLAMGMRDYMQEWAGPMN